MLCWLYCVPFSIFLYYASAPLTIMLACFILKRGICRGLLWQRYLALGLITVSIAKIFLSDLQSIINNSFILSGINYILLIISMAIIYMLYRRFGSDYKAIEINKKNDRELRIWANTSMITTIILICWELVPWLGYLTIGKAPEIFTLINWRIIAAFNFVTLLVGFWQSEEHYSYYNKSHKGKRHGAGKTWLPSDTLWLVLPLYLIAVAFGIMGDDILQ